MTPEYLNALADRADPDKLWALAGIDQDKLTEEQRLQLDTGVALRRHALHVQRLRDLLGTGQSLLIVPYRENSSFIGAIPTPAEHAARQKEHEQYLPKGTTW
jgi:hypothetical protein